MARFPLALLPFALAAVPGLAATAVTIDPKLRAEFDKSDTNKDGVLTQAEVNARIAQMSRGNKNLSAAQTRQLSTLWFSRADANHDGKVTPAEMQALFKATANRYDTNHDGVISIAERNAAHAAMLAESKAR